MGADPQGDVDLFQTTDDGDIVVVDGSPVLGSGLGPSAYMSLFGGNDSGSEWWGNLSENEPSRKYISETSRLIESLPATTGNVNRLIEAANRDLAWMVEEGVASTVLVDITLPALNKVQYVVDIIADGQESQFVFIENWKAEQ